MIFYSHSKKLEDGSTVGSKLLKVHTSGVLDNALQQWSGNLNFSYSTEELKELLIDVVLLHDLGKYTSYFQNYLLKIEPIDEKLKQHARIGSYVAYHLWQAKKHEKLPIIGLYLIFLHHSQLTVLDGVFEKINSDAEEVFGHQSADLREKIEQIEAELELPGIAGALKFPEKKKLLRSIKIWLRKNSEIQDYFLINYLFSLLIQGDKLDASDTPRYERKAIPPLTVDNFIAGLSVKVSPQNDLRNQVRQEVIRKIEEPDILQKKLFLLTAPTGIGKTYTALDFALRLRNKLPRLPQIITGLPFINIIEQTLAEYEKVLGSSAIEILGHYQYADIFDDGNEGGEESEENYYNKRMQLDTWQADIVVTSFVQLLQTLITNRNKLLLKFNHFANAIVIMDEVQSLRLEQVPIIGAVLYFISKYLNTRFILMTATKPLIFELADRELLEPALNIKSTDGVSHLLANPRAIFQQFRRTKIIPLIDNPLSESNEFITLFDANWNPDKSCLIVVNKVNRSLEVFDSIVAYLDKKNYKNPKFYLSTNIAPAHRMGIIQDIKDLIKAGKKPILIATQVVEAGVDLDFDLGFRDLGPIDSIVQVAGRINRENSEERRYSPLYIIDFGDCQRIYGRITDIQARAALGSKEILEPAYFDMVDNYFWNVAESSAFSFSQKLFKGIQKLKYDGDFDENDDFIPVNRFRVIENSGYAISVFIEYDEQAKEAREKFLDIYATRSKKEREKRKVHFNKRFKRTFHQHIVAVPIFYVEDLPWLFENNPDIRIKYVAIEDLDNWYVLPTGFKRKTSDELHVERAKSVSF